MGFLSKITRAVSKATKPAQRLVKAVSKAATKPAIKAAKKVRGAMPASAGGLVGAAAQAATGKNATPEVPPQTAVQATADAMKRKQDVMRKSTQANAVQNQTAVKSAIDEGNAAPANQLGNVVDPAIAQVAEADRKRKLGVRSARGVLRRTILG